MAASCGESSALDSPSVLVEVQEELEPNKMRKVHMHVGRAVLNRIPYFEPQLGGDLSGSSLHVRLPLGCSAEALSAVFRRMYFKELAFEKLEVDLVLPIAQCARMLCLEDLHLELVNLLGRCVQSESDVRKVIEWSSSHHDSEELAKVAKSYERKGFMLDMDKELQEMIVNTTKAPGDGETMKLIEKLFKRRAKKGPDMIQKNNGILKTVLVRENIFSVSKPTKARGQIEQVVTLTTWPGTYALLQMVARIALTSRESFDAITKVIFSKFDNSNWQFIEKVSWTVPASVVIQKISISLLEGLPCGSLSGQCVADLLRLISVSGHASTGLRQPLSNVLNRLCQEEKMKVSVGLARIEASQVTIMTDKAVLESLLGEARVTVCKRLVPVMSTLDAETRAFLVHEMFGDSAEESE